MGKTTKFKNADIVKYQRFTNVVLSIFGKKMGSYS